MSEQIELIEIEKIKPDLNQPRIEFDEKELQELASTYKTQGMIHTIEIDENNTIILGERRWRAAKLIDLEKVKATRKIGLNKATRLERQLIDDANRKDLSEMERAWAYATAVININLEAQGKEERHTIREVKEMDNVYLVNLLNRRIGTDGQRDGVAKSGSSELSRKIGVPQTTIWNYLQLLKLSPEFQEGIKKGFVVGEKEVKDEETGETELKDD
ncbi:MAG TPA: ParB/RepB/Spo0J family partition protein, partial [Candidatus Paceibacterota bacterium]|nr:ParB/RepB/Spo0J family partition protein [Candidatus Paceibacterota bacterium]